MTTFYICRHGETENNQNQKLSGWLDSPLTVHGVENVHTTAQKLKGLHFDQIQTSDLGRAVATAELVAKDLGFLGEVVRTEALREVNYGDWGGVSYKDVAEQAGDISPDQLTDFAPPKGESLRNMQKRVLAFLVSLGESSPGQTILLTGHDGTIKAIYAAFAGIDLGQYDADHEYAHDFVGKFTLDNGVINSFTEL